MTELKTLNEIFLYNHSHSEEGTPIIENSEEFENILKSEAIKWVKEFEEGGDDLILFLYGLPRKTVCECCASKNIRRVRFNERDKFPEGWFNCYICEDCDFSGTVNKMDMFNFDETVKKIKDFERTNNPKINWIKHFFNLTEEDLK